MVELEELNIKQATFTRGHVAILHRRFAELKAELDRVSREGFDIQASIENFRTHCDLLQEDYKQYELDQELRYSTEIEEFQRQNERLRDIILKKKEERQSLLESLYETNICYRTDHGDMKNFDWDTLGRLASMSEATKKFNEQKAILQQVEEFNSMNRERLDKSSELYKSMIESRDVVRNKLDQLRNANAECMRAKDDQEQTILKLTEESTRLHLLVKQGATMTSEPLSDYVSKHIRATSYSFLTASDPEELIIGLKKFKQRQSRYIKLLKHKIAVLNTDLNSLQIARDQTNDEADYYMSVIRQSRMENVHPA